MKKRIFLSVLALTLFMSCSTPRVSFDYDRKTDFSRFKTYQFKTDARLKISALDSARLIENIEAELRAKGLRLSENPDVWIEILSEERNRVDQSGRLSFGIGGGHPGFALGTSGSVPISKSVKDRFIMVNITEASNNHLVWQGVCENTSPQGLSPETKERQFREEARKLLKNYPPRK